MSTLAGRVTAIVVAVLCATLVLVGAVTAGLLHVRAHSALDRALLAAAFAEAHPWQSERFANDHVRSPVAVRPWETGDPRVPAALHAEAVSGERPLYATLGAHRVLLLVVEPESADVRGGDHGHFVVVAEAPAVTPWDVALPFLGVYLAVAAVTALAAGLVVGQGVRSAMAPLGQAAADLERVQGLGSGARLERLGPAEVDELLASANRLLDRLDAAFDAQATFTAQAAHELRTPVTVLKGEVELALRRDRSSAEYREALDRVRTEVDWLAELVEALMLLARVEAGHADRGREVERLSAVVHRAVERERPALERAGCTLTVALDDDPELRMQVALVATAVGNLLRNAAVHAPGAPVAVRLVRHDGHACVQVEDGGPGLTAAEAERVLERFQRGSTRRNGLGLGLPLAREIARRHGGDLTLGEGQGGGLRARLALAV